MKEESGEPGISYTAIKIKLDQSFFTTSSNIIEDESGQWKVNNAPYQDILITPREAKMMKDQMMTRHYTGSVSTRTTKMEDEIEEIRENKFLKLFNSLKEGSVVKVIKWGDTEWEQHKTHLLKVKFDPQCDKCAAVDIMNGEIWYAEDVETMEFEVIKQA